MQGEKPTDKYPHIWADSDGVKSENPKESQHVIAKYLHETDGIIEVSRSRKPGSTKTMTSMLLMVKMSLRKFYPLGGNDSSVKYHILKTMLNSSFVFSK